ncbi:MAG: hypothetical protein U0325_21075 [Polyangiales bacterium]
MDFAVEATQPSPYRSRLVNLVDDARDLIKRVGRLGTISERMEDALHWAAGINPKAPPNTDPEVEQALVHLRSVRLAIRLHIGQHDNFWKSVTAVLAAMVGVVAKDVQESRWSRAIGFAVPTLVLALIAYFIANNVARWKEVSGGFDNAITALEKVLDASAAKAKS